MFGLIRALGTETAGILRLRDAAQDAVRAGHAPREVSVAELDARITDPALPFTVWNGKVRMSIAGVQDKLLVYLDAPLSEGGRMFLVDA
ncbi:MAG TPA: type II toxin-antitoxin system HipA family toxin, partial [Telluria sp.]